ncbi:TlpA family protein disulfide reductase [Pedobacter cryoconitis]|uniref:TlpA family protein disulfide reductase n=1 Tax=Pedobacter cryoconitis TaxID=188932 RepID=UPI00160C7BF1|nr:TlpA disulfide reductase family protein [Pedobacter cryoconitis]MBB5644719.1 thiol-disulfide isomerase/thioredoxin [Pedobacter cryoconitis]
MKKTISIIAMATLCLFLSVTAQAQVTKQTYKPVKIGDRIPDVTLTNIYNYKTTKTNLSDFKAKLIILDFWATYCTSCASDFPKTEELQKKYGVEVQFIKVTNQTRAEALPFLEKFYKDKPSIIPSITDDKVFHKLFPHHSIPHYVWLDQSGKVVAATTGNQIKEKYIDRFLNTDTIGNMRVKIDIDTKKPLFIASDLLKNNQLKYYSIFFRGRYYGMNPGFRRINNDSGVQTGVAMTNLSLSIMYSLIMSNLFEQKGQQYQESRSIILVKNPALLIDNDEVEDDDLDERYTYGCNAPDLKNVPLYQYILEDLNRYTNYLGSIEKTKVKCLLLRRKGSADKIKTKGGVSQNTLFSDTESKITNYSLKYFMISLTGLPFIKAPLFDETGYNFNVDISLSKQTSLSGLRKELKAYNLELVEGVRYLDMFVLRDKK